MSEGPAANWRRDSKQTEYEERWTSQQQTRATHPSRLHPSAGCSSPASSDETSDVPEDRMLAAESEKKDDSDPDPHCFPISDGDFSDFQSDTGGSSSEESVHSVLATPVDEGPPGVRTRAKTKGSGEKKSPAADQKTFAEAVVLPTSNEKAHRVYDRRNYCLFCAKPLSKMARHLERVHSDKAEVAVAFRHPVNSRERRKVWKKLINHGNFVHNKDVLKSGKGLLAVRKRPHQPGRASDFLHCLYCHGLYLKKALYRHMSRCPEKVKNDSESQFGRRRVASRCALQISEDLGVGDGFRGVLCEMIYDEVTQAVIDDKVLLQFGERLFSRYGSDVKKHDYVRQQLRQLARLVLEAKKTTPLKNLENFFYPSSFPHVVSAVKVLSGYDPESKAFAVPSLAVKLGYHLQKACSIVEGNALKCGDARLAEAAKNFLSVYRRQWTTLISSGALTTLRETKRTTDEKLPFVQDVKLLNSHMERVHLLAEKKLRDDPSTENYTALARVILARTITFNRRKPGEVATIQLTAFTSRTTSNPLSDMDLSVSDLEKNMCRFFTRVDIRGGCGRTVPVLLKPSFVSALELLARHREACGVPRENPFLFGRPSALSEYKGSECVQQYVRECGARNPEALSSRKIQKHCATMLQLINLDEDEAVHVLGPDHQIQDLRRHWCTQVDDDDDDDDDEEMDSDAESSQPNTGQRAASDCRTELSHQLDCGATTSTGGTVPPKSVTSDNRGSQHKGKQKWADVEVHAVERHMMLFIRGHKVPQKDDCIHCLEAEPSALRTRSWRGVKDYVRNRITALKRQIGASSAQQL